MKAIDGRKITNGPQLGDDMPSAGHFSRRAPEKRSRMRRVVSLLWSLFLLIAFAFAGLLAGGFAHYAYVVTTPQPVLDEKVEGIVVLTGGENRIRAGVRLLKDGMGKRLLITGVNPSITDKSIQNIADAESQLFDCCIDIDRSARNTIENAIATQEWVKKTGAKSLIIVTGTFHMPRAIRELSHGVPDVKLTAFSVNVPQKKDWWRDHSRLRDMLREYAKLTIVNIRDRVNAIAGWPWPTMPM